MSRPSPQLHNQWMQMFKHLIRGFALNFSFILICSPLFAQSWKDGQARLMRGDYKGAEASLTKAYRTSKSNAEKAETLKHLGVAQYMQSKTGAAAKTFSLAAKLNPGIRLSENEVADESVIPFFNKQKSMALRSSRPTAPAKSAVPARTAAAGGTRPGISAVKSKKTLVKVLSNVPTAQVSIDGIAYGTVGSDLEVSPGTIVLEITAPGYVSKAIRIKVQPLTANTVSVDLSRPQPKPQPVARAKPVPAAPAAATASRTNPRATKGKATKAAASSPKDDLFATEAGSADDFSSLAIPPPQSPAMQAQSIMPPAAPMTPLLPQGAYMAPPMQQQMPMYTPAQPQMYPQAPYGSPYGSPYGGYAPAQPVYPQQPYQQPFPQYQQPYPQPPSVYSPYQGGFQQPMPPAADPYGGFLAPPVEPSIYPNSTVASTAPPDLGPAPSTTSSDDFGRPPPMKPPKDIFKDDSKKTSAKSRNSRDSCSAFVKLLPFGIGQFCQGSTFKGLIFAGAQAGGLFFYKQNADAAVKYQSQLNTVLEERETQRASISAGEQAAFDEETAQKESDGNAAINQANQNATMSLAVFGGAWALGVTDAFVFPPTPKKAKKSIRRTRLSLLLPEQNQPDAAIALLSHLETSDSLSKSWYLGYTLPSDMQSYQGTHGGAVKVGITWEL